MRKVFLSLVILLFATASADAKQRSMEQMKAEAGKVIKPSLLPRSGKTGGMEVLKKGELYTVIGYKTGGFAVIADDDMFAPVLGYSDTVLPDVLPPDMKWWMDVVEQSMKTAMAEGSSIEYSPKAAAGVKDHVDELLTTRWDQDDPYNRKCPKYKRNNISYTYPTGCVATAMAQIMKYYGLPTVGKGFHQYSFKPEGSATFNTLTAYFDTTNYMWDDMIDDYSKASFTAEQADAVATIMYHCGVAVEMQYNEDGSGAFSADAAAAMREYFGYDTRHYIRDVMPTDEWMDIVYGELSEGRPILYGGQSTSGGHAFVLDGYDSDGLVHVNWGWSGSGNGFFTIAGLNGYTSGQTMVLVRTDDAPELPQVSSWGMEGSFSMTGSGASVNASFDISIYNSGSDPFIGTLALVAANTATGNVTALGTLYSVTSASDAINPGYGFKFKGSSPVDISGLADGTYRVYLASLSTTDTEWQMVRTGENYTNNYILTISNGMATLTAGDSNWTPTGIDNIENDAAKGDGKVRVYDASGRILHASDADNFSINDVNARGLLIIRQGNKVTKVMK